MSSGNKDHFRIPLDAGPVFSKSAPNAEDSNKLKPDNMPTLASHPRDPLHGITLETVVKQLVERHGWSEMGHRIPIRCFQINPSVKSSLTFLRKTPWARKRVEAWFIEEKSMPE
jgi:hypothetical protein